jgi:hypothetical protein
LAFSSCLMMSTLMRARAVSSVKLRPQTRESTFARTKTTIYGYAFACQTDHGWAAQFGNSLLLP